MNLDWQSAAVAVVVVAAGAYLGRVAWHSIARRKSAACGSCGTCPAGAAGDEPQVLSVSQLAGTADRAESNSNGAARQSK